jgi:diguanylate cyclase (GGDEF)-like protein
MVGEESVRASLIPLFLLPVLWNALYDRFSETAVVIGVAVATPAVVGRYFGIQDTGDTVQPLVVWTVVAGLIAFSVQSVRAELTSALRSREDMIKRTAMVDLAAAELYSSLNPDAVVGVGLRAAAHLAVGPEGLRKESYFFTLEQDAVTLMAHYREQSDDTEPERSFQLEDVPVLRRAAEQTAPITFGAGYAATRNDESETAHSLGILGGIAISTRIPEMSEMGLTGVLVVSGGEQGRFTRDNVQQLTSFVTIFELALSRALKHAADATTDPLTGLTNRREFTRRLHTMPRGDAYALLTMQVDGLDVVNKTAGRPAGDELLVAVAARLSRRLRRGDLLARLGGDEFLVALSGLEPATARREAERVAAGLAAALADPVPVAGTEVRVGASIGVGVFPDDAADLDGLLRAADRRMYERKHALRA